MEDYYPVKATFFLPRYVRDGNPCLCSLVPTLWCGLNSGIPKAFKIWNLLYRFLYSSANPWLRGHDFRPLCLWALLSFEFGHKLYLKPVVKPQAKHVWLSHLLWYWCCSRLRRWILGRRQHQASLNTQNQRLRCYLRVTCLLLKVLWFLKGEPKTKKYETAVSVMMENLVLKPPRVN